MRDRETRSASERKGDRESKGLWYARAAWHAVSCGSSEVTNGRRRTQTHLGVFLYERAARFRWGSALTCTTRSKSWSTTVDLLLSNED